MTDVHSGSEGPPQGTNPAAEQTKENNKTNQ